MKRRDFLKTSVIASAALSLNFEGLQAALSTNTVAVEKAPDMVAVMGGEPEVMLDKALEALGGIGNFVKKGQKIVIKPNIGWDRSPELAGNTNPKLVKALVKKCLEAGASKVTVFDHTCDNWQKCYETSGIAEAVKEGLEDWQKTGCNYAMYVPETKQVNPPGEWNSSMVLYKDGYVEHWLNGEKLFSFQEGSEDWKMRRYSGKWEAFPDYGISTTGKLCFQDHGSKVYFKNVKIKDLD